MHHKEMFAEHRFMVYSQKVAWVRYTLDQLEQSRHRIGFDVEMAQRQQQSDGWVGGGYKDASGRLVPVYSEPLGFPQAFLRHWHDKVGYDYLIFLDQLPLLPITPAYISEDLVLIDIELPEEDTADQWQDPKPPFVIMEPIRLNVDQETRLQNLAKSLGGEFYASSITPYIIAPWTEQAAICRHFSQLAPVVERKYSRLT